MFTSKTRGIKQPTNNLDYKLVYEFRFRKRKYSGDGIWFSGDQVMPWCVQRGYAGHYFATLPEALKYAAKRKFISVDGINRISDKMKEQGYTE